MYNHPMRTLVIAYGNTDRQDDGVAWYVLRALAAEFGGEFPATPQECSELELDNVDLRCMLQLIPEIADDFKRYQKVVFIDAHTGSVTEEIHLEEVISRYESSPLTHHLTPASCLAIAQALHGSVPPSLLVSVRGYEFGFHQGLSERTKALVPEAVARILEWIK